MTEERLICPNAKSCPVYTSWKEGENDNDERLDIITLYDGKYECQALGDFTKDRIQRDPELERMLASSSPECATVRLLNQSNPLA
jgi:hypothetical protein